MSNAIIPLTETYFTINERTLQRTLLVVTFYLSQNITFVSSGFQLLTFRKVIFLP